jgi:hypothetical protein
MVEITALSNRIPPVNDRLLLELVNGLSVSHDIIQYRSGSSFFSRLLDQMSGTGPRRQLLLDGNLVAGQEALLDWVSELVEAQLVSNVGLQRAAASLLEVRLVLVRQERELEQQREVQSRIVHMFDDVLRVLDARLTTLQRRVQSLELELAAKNSLEGALAAWLAGRTYTGLPWSVQVILLAREVFSGASAIYEFELRRRDLRMLLCDRILAKKESGLERNFSLQSLLDEVWRGTSTHDRPMIAELLDAGLSGALTAGTAPHLCAFAYVMEFAALTSEARPQSLALRQWSLCSVEAADSIAARTRSAM